MSRKDEIISKSFGLFAVKGYNMSLSEIASELGIRKQSLYNHFSCKEELVGEVISNEVNTYFVRMHLELEDMEELPSLEKLQRVFTSIIDYFRDVEKLRFWRWIMLMDRGEPLGRIRNLIGEKERAFSLLVQEIVMDGIEEGTIKPMSVKTVMYVYVTLLQGLLDGLLMFGSQIEIDEYVECVLDFFWDSIKS